MRVSFDNLQAKVQFDAPEEEPWLDHFLSYPVLQFGRPTGKRIPLYRPLSGSFPAGLVPLVSTNAPQHGFSVSVTDARGAPPTIDRQADVSWLRDYQHAAIGSILEHTRGLIWQSTGAGKTELMAAMSRVVPGDPQLILVDLQGLLTQTAERFVRRGLPPAGIAGDGTWAPSRVTVAMVQTLAKRLRAGDPAATALCAAARVVHVDEAHGAAAATHQRVLSACPRAYFRVGYSGTPFARGDARSLVVAGALGPAIHRTQADPLIAAGVLAKPFVRFVRVAHQPRETDLLNWREEYEHVVVHNDVRNSVLLSEIQSLPKPCLVFVLALEHGELLRDELLERGVPTEFVWGARSDAQRQATIRRCAHGDTDVVVANVVFQKGIDIPELRSIVNAAGGKSSIAVVQGTGRGMRRADKFGREVKQAFTVVDVEDMGGPGWLSRHSRARRKAYAAEGYEVRVS